LCAAPPLDGAQAQQLEVRRLRSLSAAGVRVPRVVHVEAEFFVQSYLGDLSLHVLLQREQATLWWRRGLRTLVEVHRRGQYLSQPFARNILASGDCLAMIDFEDDPLEVMELHQAQARDWLAYLHSSALALRAGDAAPPDELVELLRAELSNEVAPVRALVADTARRLAWLRWLHAGDGRGWRRHVAILQSALALMMAAEAKF
jgi:hypothetical protein